MNDREKMQHDSLLRTMAHRIRLARLLDLYGPLLTDKQRDVLDLHYNQDFSLAELAEKQAVSRQAVHEAIKRGEKTLFETEERLALLSRMDAAQESWRGLVAEVEAWPDEEDEMQRRRRQEWLKSAHVLLHENEEEAMGALACEH